MIRPMLFPVVAQPLSPDPAHTVAIFFTHSDAARFVNAELPTRNLYIGSGRYDRRTHGYRYVERADLEPREIAPGHYQVAA